MPSRPEDYQAAAQQGRDAADRDELCEAGRLLRGKD